MHTELLFENQKGRDHCGNLGVDGRMLLKCISEKCNRMWGCALDSTDVDLVIKPLCEFLKQVNVGNRNFL
jgi:hypothetical protein